MRPWGTVSLLGPHSLLTPSLQWGTTILTVHSLDTTLGPTSQPGSRTPHPPPHSPARYSLGGTREPRGAGPGGTIATTSPESQQIAWCAQTCHFPCSPGPRQLYGEKSALFSFFLTKKEMKRFPNCFYKEGARPCASCGRLSEAAPTWAPHQEESVETGQCLPDQRSQDHPRPLGSG